jgi:hypothetical protein
MTVCVRIVAVFICWSKDIKADEVLLREKRWQCDSSLGLRNLAGFECRSQYFENCNRLLS